MDKNKKSAETLWWNAFVDSGSPGYYMLYKAMKEEEELEKRKGRR